MTNPMKTGSYIKLLAMMLGALVVIAACAPAPTPPTPTATPVKFTDVKPYVVPIGSQYRVTPLLSAGDRVPETSDSSLKYQMLGIPDGLGAYKNDDGTTTLFMNHELLNDAQTEPVVGKPLHRGAIVSKFILGKDGKVISGERAYDSVYNENTLVGPAAQVDNTTPAFARFCSASLAGPEVGFDRNIFFTNEETVSPKSFDGKGGLTVAIFNNEAHALPKLGHLTKENSLVMPTSGELTVIISLEDGPATPDSQLYMYVGQKDQRPGATVLARNGLDNGKLYVLAPKDASKDRESKFQSGSIEVKWVEIPNAEGMSDAELETASDAGGAFGFVRIEDGAFSKTSSTDFFFVTTGGNEAEGNKLGRLYHLRLSSANPTGSAALNIVYNADQVVSGGGDIAVSPDNIDTSADYLMINEDGITESRPTMAAKGRDGSVWRFALKRGPEGTDVDVTTATRVAALGPPGRDGVAVGPGVWETSGIIDASKMFGGGSWLTVAQAHTPSTAPAPNTIEDGQLLLITPAG